MLHVFPFCEQNDFSIEIEITLMKQVLQHFLIKMKSLGKGFVWSSWTVFGTQTMCIRVIELNRSKYLSIEIFNWVSMQYVTV